MSARRAVVVYAHPCHDSYIAAARSRAVEGLERAGCTTTVVDLYRDGYQPGDAPADEHLRALRTADLLVFVHPTWWGAQPAILLGWMTAVTATGERFETITTVASVCSHGSDRFNNWLGGRPGFHVLGRFIRASCRPGARRRWIAMYSMDKATADQRTAFLDALPGAVTALTH